MYSHLNCLPLSAFDKLFSLYTVDEAVVETVVIFIFAIVWPSAVFNTALVPTVKPQVMSALPPGTAVTLAGEIVTV